MLGTRSLISLPCWGAGDQRAAERRLDAHSQRGAARALHRRLHGAPCARTLKLQTPAGPACHLYTLRVRGVLRAFGAQLRSVSRVLVRLQGQASPRRQTDGGCCMLL